MESTMELLSKKKQKHRKTAKSGTANFHVHCCHWESNLKDNILRIRISSNESFQRPISLQLFNDTAEYECLSIDEISVEEKRAMRFRTCWDNLGKIRSQIRNSTMVVQATEAPATKSTTSLGVKGLENQNIPTNRLTSTESNDGSDQSSVTDFDVKVEDSESNFFNKTLDVLQPKHAVQPLWMYGFDVKLVHSIEDIYELEGLAKAEFVNWEDLNISEDAVKIEEFIKKLVKNRLNTNEHFVKTIILSVYDYMEKGDARWIDAFVKEYKEKRHEFREFWQYTFEMVRSKEEIDMLNESDLQECVQRYLLLDAWCCQGTLTSLPPFKHLGVDCVGQKCYPNLKYCLSIPAVNLLDRTNKLPLLTKVVRQMIYLTIKLDASSVSRKARQKIFMECFTEKEEEQFLKSVNISIQLVWQVLEQCLSLMVNANHDIAGKTKVLQSGLVIVENKVRSLVLCMDASVLKKLRDFGKAEDTINWLFATILRKQDLWCSFYIDANEYWITDAIRLSRYTYVNFGKAV